MLPPTNNLNDFSFSLYHQKESITFAISIKVIEKNHRYFKGSLCFQPPNNTAVLTGNIAIGDMIWVFQTSISVYNLCSILLKLEKPHQCSDVSRTVQCVSFNIHLALCSK